jgi:hypothetical protein
MQFQEYQQDYRYGSAQRLYKNDSPEMARKDNGRKDAGRFSTKEEITRL